MKEQPGSKTTKNQDILRYAGLATQWVIMLGIAVWLGMMLDRWIAWKFPVFLIAFPLIALIFSLWKIIKEFSKPNK